MKNALFRKRMKQCIAALAIASLTTSLFYVPVYAAEPERADIQARAQQLFDQARVSADMEEKKDPNEVIRVLVAVDTASAVEQTGEITYTQEVQQAEDKALAAQEKVIRAVEKLTGNQVINRSGYLVNTFSIEMTRAQMAIVAEMDGVESVSPVTVCMFRVLLLPTAMRKTAVLSVLRRMPRFLPCRSSATAEVPIMMMLLLLWKML